MLDTLDAIIATAGIVLALSLIVQAVQQIIKQVFDLKSSYMRNELLALFHNGNMSTSFMSNFKPLGRLANVADDLSKKIVNQLEERVASFGYKDLELLENVDAIRMKEMVKALPVAKDTGVKKEFALAVAEIDRWFEVSKKAFQDHYERRMKLWSFIVSAVVVMGLNSNLFVVYQDFASIKTLRDAAAAWAEQAIKNPVTNGRTAADSSEANSAATVEIKERIAEIQSYIGEQSLQLCRWNTARGDSIHLFSSPVAIVTKAPVDFFAAAGKNGIGWLAMTLLVSLGAPFWYDFLKTVTGMKEKLRSVTKNTSNQD